MTSQSHTIRSQSREIVKFVKIMTQTFFNCESTCDFTYFPSSIYDRLPAARRFATINVIIRPLSLAESLLEGALGTEWLSYV